MSGLVIITGGSRGIGASVARLASQRGWDVCLSYRADRDAALGVVADCQAHGVAALAVQADVSVEADVVRLFVTAEQELGPVTGLVNNAGIVARQSRVEDLDASRIERVWLLSPQASFTTGAFLDVSGGR